MKERDSVSGVEKAWDFWISQHPVTVPDLVVMGVDAAVSKWLNENKDYIVEAIAWGIREKKENE